MVPLITDAQRKELIDAHESIVQKQFTPWNTEDIRFLALALAGEAGELANKIKKHWRGDRRPHPSADPEVFKEVTDVIVYTMLLVEALEFDPTATIAMYILPEIREKLRLKK